MEMFVFRVKGCYVKNVVANNSKIKRNIKNAEERQSLEEEVKINTSALDLISGVAQKKWEGLNICTFKQYHCI